MINNSVSKAYFSISSMSDMVEKAEKEGVPKDVKKISKPSNKKGLLTRSQDMFKYANKTDNKGDISKEQQKLVVAYVLRIRKAFEEVKNGRATSTKS